MNFALRIYRRLAEAFPHEFKMIYGTEMLQLGEDVVEEIAKQHGVAGLIRLVVDIAIRVPVEYLSEMRRDLRYAVRALIKAPGFALVGIISLGLGMGVTTSVFSTLWAQMFRPLAAASNSDELVMPQGPASYYYIEQYRAQKSLFAGVAAFQNGVPFNVAFQGNENAKPERVYGQLVAPDYFSVLGVKPQRGRVLSAEIDKPGDAPVVVITDRFWRHRLNSSPDALGQTLRLNGQTATIVGITPKDFTGAMPIVPAELFVPVTVPAALAPELANDVVHKRDAKQFLAILRLAPGVTVESAEAGLDSITRHLDEQDTSNPVRADKGRRVTLVSGGTMVPILCRAERLDLNHCVYESGEYAAGAGRCSPKGAGDSPRGRSQPLPAYPADDERRHFARNAGGHSRRRNRLLALHTVVATQAAASRSGRVRLQS
jgi:hypothetical protein